ncbi:hypothetical protein F5883DRAFT_130005 [Diaporthe sp. PMI_573]|nr:hypothetical protein F5883DRAFT_130005 [Diaporthaceae sp. PMI_573]
MSSIGPQLPPHLTKRKRSPEDRSPDSPSTKTSRPNNDNEIALDGEGSDSDDGYGQRAPKPTTAGPQQRPSIGPSLPPTAAASGSNTDEIALGSDSDDDDTGPAPPPPKPTAQQPRRVMGPAPPPADLAQRPTTAPDSNRDSGSDSDSDDDYGPALPGAAPSRNNPSLPRQTAPSAPEKPARDDWMLAPPEPTGYQERDPTKIKARKFASGAGATSRPTGISSIWTETPEEKAKRLADAVLGRGGDEQQQQQQQAAAANRGKKSGAGGASSSTSKEGQQDKIRAFTEQTRGRSLVEQHQAAKKAGAAGGGGGSGGTTARKGGGGDEEEEDDDPSKRAFDREKDMGLGMKITASQRKELLNRASDFGGRFQKGNYL